MSSNPRSKSKSKSRRPRGSKHASTSLRESDVVAIRRRVAAGESQSSMCAEYGISSAACSNIVTRKTWKHITERSGNSVIYHDEYHIWNSMVQRCTNPKHPSYTDYGGRGIKVDETWLDFEVWLADVGRRPSSGHSLDRIDPNKGYYKENIRWATDKVQARNKRGSIYLDHPTRTGEKIQAADLADELGIDYRTFRKQMIDQGKWPTKE